MGIRPAGDRGYIAVADAAYRHARVVVYDTFPAGRVIDSAELTSDQREALTSLLMAEANLANYRHDCLLESV
jgi:hypothetical protein